MSVELIESMGDDLAITDQMILEAYRRGYRVTDDGRLTSPTGRCRAIRLYGTQRYPTFAIQWKGKTQSGVFGIPIHQFAAFCFFGNDAFATGLVVRHRDDDRLNVRRDNIVMGTYSENELDKPAAVRSRSARLARRAQGSRPSNALFDLSTIHEIRDAVAKGGRGTQARLARFHKVTPACISLIVRELNYVS